MADDVDEPIHVVAYDPAWAEQGRELVAQVRAELHDLPVDVAHIGSTAVVGLTAKPVLDILVGASSGSIREAVTRLRSLGFEHLGQAGVEGREYLRRRTGRPANVHVVERAADLWNNNILFRDYLAAHPAASARYGRAKERAARQADTLLAYSELKAQIVSELLAEARRNDSGGCV